MAGRNRKVSQATDSIPCKSYPPLQPFPPQFRHAKHLSQERLLKIGGAGVFGVVAAIPTAWEAFQAGSLAEALLTLAAMPLLIMMGAALLVLADVTRRRVRDGKRTDPLARLLFGAGVWSLVLWTIGALLVGFPLAFWLGSMTAAPP